MRGKKPAKGQASFDFVEVKSVSKAAEPVFRCMGPACKYANSEGCLKLLGEFKVTKAGIRHKWCKACTADEKLRRKLGMKPTDFQKILSEQKGVCAVCGEVEEKGVGKTREKVPLKVDYVGDLPRGLLCGGCIPKVKFLEWMMSNTQWYVDATDYIEKYEEKGK